MRHAVVTALAATGLAVTAPDVGSDATALTGTDFPAAVLALVSLLLLGAAGWAVLVGVLASVPALRGAAVALTPRLLRGALFAGVTATVAVAPAHADADHVLDGLRLPDRPLVSTAPAARPLATNHVVVLPGDSLWGIAAEHLGARADAAVVADATRRWYAANRRVIGPDPDLIRPGQHLAPPQEDRS